MIRACVPPSPGCSPPSPSRPDWPAAQTLPPFQVEEASIADIHAALRAGRVTCRGLVERYLRRIDAYDKNGPAVNAIVLVNPQALAEADGLDARMKAGGTLGALHCIPTIVKDNFETAGLQSSNGSLTFEGYVPATDAFQVARIKAAGAIVLAKSNLAEWAFTPNETLSSILPGYTRNPYALDRVTAGSSGGTAAVGGGQLRRRWSRVRHRQFDSRAVVAPGAGRHPFDDGTHQPRRRVSAQPAGRHRRADGAHGRRRHGRVPGGGRGGSRTMRRRRRRAAAPFLATPRR